MTVADRQWIVTLHYSFQDDEYLYMIMEFCSGGDLMGLLIRKDIFSERATKFYIAEMILGISSLHRLGYVHRRPEARIIFSLTSQGHVKLTDMGPLKETRRYNQAGKGAKAPGECFQWWLFSNRVTIRRCG